MPLAEAARAAVRGLVDGVASDPRLANAGRIRWAVTENLHLTIRFLGATAPDRVPEVVAAAEEAARTARPFPVRLAGAGAFPGPDRPRVVWLGIVEGDADLAALAGTLSDRLAGRGWEADTRPFRAHLTLGRADGVPEAGRAVAALADVAERLDAAWTVDRLIVYQSDLGRGLARYRPLATALFGPGSLPGRPPLG